MVPGSRFPMVLPVFAAVASTVLLTLSHTAVDLSQSAESIPRDPKLQITFFGATHLLIDDGKAQVLIDDFFSRPMVDPLLVTTVRTNERVVDRVLRDHKIYRLKAILVSHSHYDQVLESAYIAKKQMQTCTALPRHRMWDVEGVLLKAT